MMETLTGRERLRFKPRTLRGAELYKKKSRHPLTTDKTSGQCCVMNMLHDDQQHRGNKGLVGSKHVFTLGVSGNGQRQTDEHGHAPTDTYAHAHVHTHTHTHTHTHSHTPAREQQPQLERESASATAGGKRGYSRS
jgi:hypothetical protein